jgi:hypothetical protein
VTSPLSAVALAFVATACGGSGGGGSPPTPPAASGTWVLDVDRTLTAAAPGTITASAAAARDARLRTAFASDAYTLALAADSTFRLDMRRGSTPFHVAGAWRAAAGHVLLTVSDVGGTALVPAERPVDTLVEDGGGLRLEDGGRTLYLRRP